MGVAEKAEKANRPRSCLQPLPNPRQSSCLSRLSPPQSTQHLKSRLSPDPSQCVFHSELCSLNFSKTILPFLFGPLMYLSFLVADFCKLRCFFELNTCLYFTPLCTPYFCTLRRPQENLCCLYSQHTFRIRSVPSVLENLEMKICTRYTVIGSDH